MLKLAKNCYCIEHKIKNKFQNFPEFSSICMNPISHKTVVVVVVLHKVVSQHN